MPAEYTDSAGCVRRVTVSLEADVRVEAARKRAAKGDT
jgi:hypothetical protein